MHERSVTAQIPSVARGRTWLAAALLEAPDVDGAPGTFKAIEAVPGGQVDGVPTGEVPDTISTRHAEHDPGWYRLQWYDDGQNSKFSKPVQVEAANSSRRWG